MKKSRICIAVLAIAWLLFAGCARQGYAPPEAPIREVPFTAVKIDDSFWKSRIETNRKVTIPAAFRECEKNGRIKNFAIAAGFEQGEHTGDFPFDDTDVYKVIEGAAYSLAAQYDAGLDKYLDEVISVIAAAQEPDGYLTTCVTNRCERLSRWWGARRWEKINSHELYNSGHLYEAAVAHYYATGKRSLLDVAVKNADLVCETFGPGEGQIHRPSGHPIIEMALVKLYKATGNEKYLETAKYFVEETGRGTDGHPLSQYSQDHMPILQQEEIVGHAVRAGYLYSGVADVASLTQDTAYFHAIRRIWDNMASKKLYITGGIGSRAQGEGFGPEYELHNHTAYCETCAAIANMYWSYRMFLATGQAKYADVYERALYNGVLSGVSLSGDKFFYDNPLESMGQHQREAWFGCACCPGNITRFMASVPQYVYATQGNDIYVNLYIQSDAQVGTATNEVAIRQETEMPAQGNVRIAINPKEGGKEWALRLRLPGWAAERPVPSDLYAFLDAPTAKPEIKVNGKKADWVEADGYAAIARRWEAGDEVELALPMDVRRIAAHEAVVDDRGKMALQRGPLVYCFEGADQPDGTIFDKFIDKDAPIEVLNDDNGGLYKLRAKGHKLLPGGEIAEAQCEAVPYVLWCNRGPNHMAVWMAADREHARPEPEPTIASQAEMYAEPSADTGGEPAATSNLQWAWGYNDQWEPSSSADTSKPYHYWWLKKGSEENICYRFSKPTAVGSVDVYWLDFDAYDGNYRVPESWRLLYLDEGGYWQPVRLLPGQEYGVKKDAYNSAAFEPVTTRALKLSAKLQAGQSAGVIEWKAH